MCAEKHLRGVLKVVLFFLNSFRYASFCGPSTVKDVLLSPKRGYNDR